MTHVQQGGARAKRRFSRLGRHGNGGSADRRAEAAKRLGFAVTVRELVAKGALGSDSGGRLAVSRASEGTAAQITPSPLAVAQCGFDSVPARSGAAQPGSGFPARSRSARRMCRTGIKMVHRLSVPRVLSSRRLMPQHEIAAYDDGFVADARGPGSVGACEQNKTRQRLLTADSHTKAAGCPLPRFGFNRRLS